MRYPDDPGTMSLTTMQSRLSHHYYISLVIVNSDNHSTYQLTKTQATHHLASGSNLCLTAVCWHHK